MTNYPPTPEEIIEGAPFKPSIELVLGLMQRGAADPNDPAFRAILHTAELVDAAEAAGFGVVVEVSRPCVDVKGKRLKIPLPIGPGMYAAVLHEFGHIYGPGQDTLSKLHAELCAGPDTSMPYDDPRFPPIAAAIIEAEIGAWEWAMGNAVLWVPEMGLMGSQALCSYISTAIMAPTMPEGFFPMIERLARGRG